MLKLASVFLLILSVTVVNADDPYRFFTWTVTYGTISPLGRTQQGILIEGEFPGPLLFAVTNDNIILNVINKLDEPFLLTFNGIKQRKNSWQDGVVGTNCPIPPNSNYTYKFQMKDQIGTFTYFPTTAMHRASGGFGPIWVYQRPKIPVPYNPPESDFMFLVGDWYKAGHKALRRSLDSGKSLGFPDGLQINGGQNLEYFGDQGKSYLFHISNVGLSTSINFRMQNHTLKLVEVEGSHTIQNDYDPLDIHVGQSMTVMVTLDQPPNGYYIVVSSRFARKTLTATATFYYQNGLSGVLGPVPAAPTTGLYWSMRQARTFRWNLTASAARPNPQGSYHYGTIPRTRSLVLSNSAPLINGKQRYAVNGVSYVVPDTPVKLADHFNITGIISWDTILTNPTSAVVLQASVLRFNLHDFIEIVFQNTENTMQSWHLDGYDFWVVGYGIGQWTETYRKRYNLVDAVTRHTVQVYPKGWSAILVSLDNQGMWNVRSAMWARQYLGQQFYMKVWTTQQSLANEYAIPPNALLCGKAAGHHHHG